jgi:hypothetical protein
MQIKKLLSKDFEIRKEMLNKIQNKFLENSKFNEQIINEIKLKNIINNNSNISNSNNPINNYDNKNQICIIASEDEFNKNYEIDLDFRENNLRSNEIFNNQNDFIIT